MRYAFRALLAALSETPPDDRERARSQALADAVFTLEAVRDLGRASPGHGLTISLPPCAGTCRRATCRPSLTC